MFDFSNVTAASQLRKVTFDDIKEYCIANGKINWLVSAIHEYTITDENGENAEFQFLPFKQEFIAMMGFKFEKKAKKPTVLEQLAELEAMAAKASSKKATADIDAKLGFNK